MEIQNSNTWKTEIKELPNATAVLVMGICSIVFCCCYSIPGIVLGIIAIVLGNKGRMLYQQNPMDYTESSYKNLNAGFICGIIGTILSLLYLVYLVVIVIFILKDPEFLDNLSKSGNNPFEL